MMSTVRTGKAGSSTMDGLAPRGMLWVAWRQRRSLILITLALYTVTAAGIVVRGGLRARDLASTGVTDPAVCGDVGMTTTVLASCERWLAARDSWATVGNLITVLPGAICLLFGLGLGAAAVGHEFDRGQGTFSFTQSVSPIRWAAYQLAMVAVSTTGGVLVLDGVITALADDRLRNYPSTISFGAVDLWFHPALLLSTICLAFAASVLTRSSSGGFWGGLGFVVVAAFVVALFTGFSGSADDYTAGWCTHVDEQLCERIQNTVSRFGGLVVDQTGIVVNSWIVAMAGVGLAGLVGGFLLLRRRVR